MSVLLFGLPAPHLEAQTRPQVDSYRRLDWTGRGSYHRLGLFREQENTLDRAYEVSAVPPEEPTPDEERPALPPRILRHLSVDAHSNTMFFHSDNIFNTDGGEIDESQYAEFVGALLDLDLDPLALRTTFDQSWFWFADHKKNDFGVSTVWQGMSYDRAFLDAAAVTLTPSWQYSELRNRRSDDRLLRQWVYGLNNELAFFLARAVIGTFSYNFAFLDAAAPGGANDKLKHDFNTGFTLIPIEDVPLYVSPSVQFSYEDFHRTERRDHAWTPTLALSVQPLAFLAFDMVGSYTDSRSNAARADYDVWASTFFLRLFYRL